MEEKEVHVAFACGRMKELENMGGEPSPGRATMTLKSDIVWKFVDPERRQLYQREEITKVHWQIYVSL